jgi:hypothetical protein
LSTGGARWNVIGIRMTPRFCLVHIIVSMPTRSFPTRPVRTAPEIAIAEIVIAERHRQDMGDIVELAANIEKTWLLHLIPPTHQKGNLKNGPACRAASVP